MYTHVYIIKDLMTVCVRYHTHTHTRTRAHSRTHAHARTHTRTHTHTHTHTRIICTGNAMLCTLTILCSRHYGMKQRVIIIEMPPPVITAFSCCMQSAVYFYIHDYCSLFTQTTYRHEIESDTYSNIHTVFISTCAYTM